jgi:hypothetical protein
MNMVQDFASSRLATVIQAVIDGPKEHSTYDSIIEESVHDLRLYSPGAPGGDGTTPHHPACNVAWTCPQLKGVP